MKIEGHTDVGVWRNADVFQDVRIFERSIMSESASAKSAKSLFDKLGGTKGIEAVVEEFLQESSRGHGTQTLLRQDQYDVATDAAGPIFHPSSGRTSAL